MEWLWRIVRVFLLAGIGILFFVLAIRGYTLSEVFSVFSEANPFLLVAGVALAMVSHWVRGWRWALLLNTSRYSMRKSVAFYSVMIGYLTNLALPRAGEAIRCVVASRREKIPFGVVAGTVVMERAVDFLILTGITVVTLIVQAEELGSFFVKMLGYRLTRKDVGGVLLVVVGLTVVGGIVFWLVFRRKSMRALRIMVMFKRFLMELKQGIVSIFHLRSGQQVLFWLQTAVIWVLYYLMTWLPVVAIPEMKGITAEQVLGFFVYGSWGIVAPVQGGIGTYHWLAKQALVIYGYEPLLAVQTATTVHTVHTIGIILVGALSFVGLSLVRDVPDYR